MKILYHDNPADAAENPAYYYYQIMNILDNAALSNRELTADEISALDYLNSKDGCAIEDIADANDCYTADDELCSTWDEMVIALRGLFESGERVPI
jgi:hypothetical protein